MSDVPKICAECKYYEDGLEETVYLCHCAKNDFTETRPHNTCEHWESKESEVDNAKP